MLIPTLHGLEGCMGAQHVCSAGTLLSPGCISTLAAWGLVHHLRDPHGRPSATMHVCADAACTPVDAVSLLHPFASRRADQHACWLGSVCWAWRACTSGRLMQAVVCAMPCHALCCSTCHEVAPSTLSVFERVSKKSVRVVQALCVCLELCFARCRCLPVVAPCL